MVEVVSGLLKRAVVPTQMMVGNLVKIELAYINTSHPDFIGGSRAVAQLMRKLELEKDAAKSKVHDLSGGGNGGNGNDIDTSSLSASLQNILEEKENGSLSTVPLVDTDGAGGILNFVFGRGKTPNKPPAKSIFRTPGGANGGVHGPPSIVQLPQVPDTMRQTDCPPTDREKN
mmetsp:Transcript_1872/g.2803  ORF Transcript_1872/g.2803 Transcript_1872/m.2803 type:complete len:173 (+) Transcript_1872:3-521(+)